ncbi:uncharacterized protein LOC124274567 [Haliotis rubra]|uniref:uncharacterized protein LOC124274567 n=1 Tax=Haliotis rubra TaxID=36100 RepID=UPI001EE52146|nr:uncharacterized protein LOC124274567 [Haliotis rubra]
MLGPHQLFTGNKSLTMFGRVIFLLYLPAICFSLALFPNAGHKTQRRQNPDENMVNVSSSVLQAEEDPCMERLGPCMHNLRHYLALQGPQQIVVDGRLAVPCGSNLDENWNCINAASQCRNHDFFLPIITSQRTWDFICQNSPAFLAGRDCLGSSQLPSAVFGCDPSINVCIPTCVQASVLKIPECSSDDANLLRRLSAIMTAPMQETC